METPGPDFDELGVVGQNHLEQTNLNEYETKDGDPRDYFRKTIFERIGQDIDPDKSHPWEDISYDNILVRSEHGTVISGETFSQDPDSGELESGLLLAAQSKEGRSNSIFLKEIDSKRRDVITATLDGFTPVIPAEERFEFANTIIDGFKQIDGNYPSGLMALQLSEFSLSHLPDQPEKALVPESFEWGEDQPTAEQAEQLYRILDVVANKMNAEKFQEKVNDLQEDLKGSYLNRPFSGNFHHLITTVAAWPVKYGGIYERDYESVKRDQPKIFPVTDQIRRPIRSREQLDEVLSSLPAEEIPHQLQNFDEVLITGTRAEFVPLDQLVGGWLENNSWTVSSATGRGAENIYRLTEAFQSADGGGIENHSPITVKEYKGKYYINTDGRHRSAALKALGISRYPMLVTHMVDRNPPENS